MATWGAYKNKILRSVLGDKSLTKATWNDDMLLDALEVALLTFAMHTAKEAMTVYNVTGDVLLIPSDVVGKLEDGSLFEFTSSATSTPAYLKPYHMATGASITYRTWGDQIVLPEGSIGSLTLYYYAYWPLPTGDDSEVELPAWAYAPLSYLIGSVALTPIGLQSSNIRQWEEAKPEQNALRVQQKHLLDIYDREITRFPKQDRLNGFNWLYE